MTPVIVWAVEPTTTLGLGIAHQGRSHSYDREDIKAHSDDDSNYNDDVGNDCGDEAADSSTCRYPRLLKFGCDMPSHSWSVTQSAKF